MSCYRRVRVPGASYFFTVNLASRGGAALSDHIGALRLAYARTAAEHPVFCDAMVVLPDHIHAVWTLPPEDVDYSIRWRKIKARFTRFSRLSGATSLSKEFKRERGVWQRRFWEHTIRDDEDYASHIRYCWGNPVKHGLVTRAVDWPFSSIHRDIRAGRVDAEWAGEAAGGGFGE